MLGRGGVRVVVLVGVWVVMVMGRGKVGVGVLGVGVERGREAMMMVVGREMDGWMVDVI